MDEGTKGWDCLIGATSEAPVAEGEEMTDPLRRGAMDTRRGESLLRSMACCWPKRRRRL